jgi:hypothetical protein
VSATEHRERLSAAKAKLNELSGAAPNEDHPIAAWLESFTAVDEPKLWGQLPEEARLVIHEPVYESLVWTTKSLLAKALTEFASGDESADESLARLRLVRSGCLTIEACERGATTVMPPSRWCPLLDRLDAIIKGSI